MTVFIAKRIYEPADPGDGYRVLVDRLWPRGVSKERAALDQWAKDIAPSTDLRKWYGHDPIKYSEFVKRYKEEVKDNPDALALFADWRTHKKVTLLYGARTEDNEATVLKEYLL